MIEGSIKSHVLITALTETCILQQMVEVERKIEPQNKFSNISASSPNQATTVLASTRALVSSISSSHNLNLHIISLPVFPHSLGMCFIFLTVLPC